MAPKKPNGFMFFVFEWKEKHGRKMNLAQATSAAGEVWKKFTPKQKEPYLKRALTSPIPAAQKMKLSCTGTPLEYIENETKEKKVMEENMVKIIAKTIKLANDENRLKEEKFFFVEINYFTRLLNTDIVIPAEIAIAEFSLMDGVRRSFHVFVNPDIQFYGNMYAAKKHSETTHGLPLPPDAIGESNMSKISSDIFKFILEKDGGFCPPIYARSDSMGCVSSALTYIAEESRSEDDDLRSLNIYSIEELFFALTCTTCVTSLKDKPEHRYISDAVLARDAFEYASGIACTYHHELDRSNYCALSRVYRWGFTFADYLAKNLSITMIPGHHVPAKANDTHVKKSSSNHPDESFQSTCEAMSSLSVESKYLTCYDSDQNTFVPSDSNKIAPRKYTIPKTTNTVSEPNIDSVYDECSPGPNPWKRQDDSKPPDSRYFSIDYDGDEEKSSVAGSSVSGSTVSRRSVRGRGIVIIDGF